jgi:antitoxin ParD1/3/4
MSIIVDLPDAMKAFVDSQVAAGGYAGPSEYVQALIRQASQGHGYADLQAKLLVGIDELDCGQAKEMTKEDWSRIKSDYLARHAK